MLMHIIKLIYSYCNLMNIQRVATTQKKYSVRISHTELDVLDVLAINKSGSNLIAVQEIHLLQK